MNSTIRHRLIECSDEKYQIFTSKLLPDIDNILGVRLPELNKIAKEIAKEDWRNYLTSPNNKYFEEVMLQGMVIGYAKAELSEILTYVETFVPKINNWSVCDSFCGGLKITNKNKKEVFDFLKPYFSSENEYEVRFAVVMIIKYYIEDSYIKEVLDILNNINHQGYYVKMAVAWCLSMCYVKLPIDTMEFLNNNKLDKFTYNKALQKIVESRQVDKETKKQIKQMKHV